MEKKTNWEIVQRCRTSTDQEAWEEFVDRFESALRGGIFRAFRSLSVRGDYSDRQADLLQDCYCKLLDRECRILNLCRESHDGALWKFFVTLGERVARDAFRAQAAEKRGGEQVLRLEGFAAAIDPADPGQSPERAALAREAEADLVARCRRAAGRRQSERNFRVLLMAFLEGLTSREIARRLDGTLTPTSVDSLVYRARRRIEKSGRRLGPRRVAA